jgi:hypothetical protein
MGLSEHDIYCPVLRQGGCACELIARVRKDERSLIRVSKEVRVQSSKAYRNGFSDGVASLNGPAGNSVSP